MAARVPIPGTLGHDRTNDADWCPRCGAWTQQYDTGDGLELGCTRWPVCEWALPMRLFPSRELLLWAKKEGGAPMLPPGL